MPLSREELREKLRASLGNGNGEQAPAAPAKAAKPVKPAKADNPFARRSKPVVEVVEEEVDGGAVAVADEEEDSYIPDESHRDGEPDATPVEELVDHLKTLIDFVVNNGEALKSWLDIVR